MKINLGKGLFIFFCLYILGCDIFSHNSDGKKKIQGCRDSTACNYNKNATEDDGNCTYEKDCWGVCGGTAAIDECGVCGGNGDCSCPGGTIKDCMGVCGGVTVNDECGICGGYGIEEGKCDCGGNINDECGVCGGDGIEEDKCDCNGNILDCNGNCGGGVIEDECGVCGGDGTTCEGLWAIYYDVETPINGFQFDVTGVTITGASGGDAETFGFMISYSGTTALGFSLAGTTIPSGSGIMVILAIDGNKDDACLTGIVLSDGNGDSIAIEQSSCITIIKED